MRLKYPAALLVLGLLAAASGWAQEITLAPDHPDGVYHAGDTITWQIDWPGPGNPPAATFKFLYDGRTELEHGAVPFSANHATLKLQTTAPETILAVVDWTAADGKKQRALAGAVVSPRKIFSPVPAPADFAAFWQAKLDELAAVPAAPMIEPVAVQNPAVRYWKITLNNIRGTHIHGQLARPASGESFPALLILQWAGVYPLQKDWVTSHAAQGWLTLDIEAHDLPIDEPESFYKKAGEGPLNDYAAIGNTDRDTSYFLRMYLSCSRALDYLTHRPDWNGKTLVVMGGSQGGMQTLMLAGLHPAPITAAMAMVPAGCDMLAPEFGKAPGWPEWYFKTYGGRDAAAVHAASRYYDPVNFAANIRCPVLIGFGLIDETSPPSSVLAAVNRIATAKEVMILPKSDHTGHHDTQKAYNERVEQWLATLQKGGPPPVKPTSY